MAIRKYPVNSRKKNGWDCIGIWSMGKEKIINRCLTWSIKIPVFFSFCDRYRFLHLFKRSSS